MMKKFILHSVLFSGLVLGTILLVFWQADGYSDFFYARFTTPKQSSLILGTSKAAQGLQPAEFKKVLPNHDLYNFAFTVAHSPYGPAYLNGIKGKISEETRGGIFILAVDAYSIAANVKHLNDETKFDENSSFLNNLSSVNAKPNVEYLASYYKDYYLKIFQRNPIAFLHGDGWLEINATVSDTLLERRIKEKKEDYQRREKQLQFSETRLSYLYKTIRFLEGHGTVYLVRLPVHSELAEADARVVNNFDSFIANFALEHQVPYLDLSAQSEQYTFIDGLHLYKGSGKEVSKEIALWIKSLRSK